MELKRVILFLGEARLEALIKVPNRAKLIRIQYGWKEKIQSSVPPKNWITTVLREAGESVTGSGSGSVPFY